MPKLRNLTCSLQWAATSTAFQEYGTCYGDGIVETYIVIPNHPQQFTIHVTSKGFISEGLAVLVFIDGQYQTNRIRLNLLPAKKGLLRERTELDLTLRQKEKPMGDGLYMGRAWRFDHHNIVPALPEGVTNNHFDELGTIDVIIIRCFASDADDTTESTTSSAAQSDILEALDRYEETQSGTDNETDEEEKPTGKKSKKDKSKSDKLTTTDATAEREGDLLPMFGVFDGPSDYPPPNQTFEQWHWPARPLAYPHHNRPPSGYDHWSSDAPSHYYYQGHTSSSHQYPGPPPPEEHRPQSEKKVHFDYGHDHGPAADHARYSDGYDTPGSYSRGRPYSHDNYYTPVMSDWYANQPDQYSDKPGYEHLSRPYNMESGRYRPQPGHQGMPPLSSRTNQPPWHHQYTPYTSHYPEGARRPNFAVPPPWTRSHPANQLPTPSMYGMPPVAPPGYYHPYSSLYPPYAGMPPFPNAAGDKSDAEKNDNNQDQDGIRNPGSIDPAGDDGKNDQVWGTTNDSDTNNLDANGKQDDWGNNNNDSNGNSNNYNGNLSNGDNDQNKNTWENDNSNNQNDSNAWDNDNGNNNGIQDGNNNHLLDDCSGNQANSSGWDNNDASKLTGSGEDWNNSRKASAASHASDSSVRPLYGPHGPYYAVQLSTAPEVDYDAEEEPKYDVPQSFVNKTGSTKQVQPGKGYLYWKKRSHPEYIDRLEEPYARFVFKYRTREQIQKELSINLETEPSGNPEIRTFQNMGKDELIQMLVRAKGALGGKIPSPPPRVTDSADAAVRNVPVNPPIQEFLRYDIPFRPGGVQGRARSGTAPDEGGNDSCSASNDNTNNANNESWNTRDNSDNNGNASGYNNDWNSGGDGWGNGNNAGVGNNNNETAGGWDAEPKNDFPKESWEAAAKQQQSGPPPPPPPRGGW